MWTSALLIAIFLFLYPFVIYPAVLHLLARRRRPAQSQRNGEYPSVAMVICALNEQKVIDEKMKNCLALQYPSDRFRIIVVSDGSTDRTAGIVRGYGHTGIELIDVKKRRGKIANLNSVIPSLDEEIIVLSDANVMYQPDAILRLVDRFADPTVGCVSGKVILTDSAPALDGPTKGYYSLEWFLQEQASEIYSMVGADGAMYALRRALFQPCPNDTIIEDFVIPMGVVRQGKRVVYEPSAVAWEQGSTSLQEEFRRKVRIAAGSVQGLLRQNALPKNAPPRFWFVYLSHKLLRWLSPIAGLSVLVFSSLSIDQFLSQLVVGGFALMCGLALTRFVTGWTHPVLSGPFYFLFGQVALGFGLLKGMAGNQTVLWAKADR
jgi:cellulose synthase/poly-beta-1,6-N-acetylglucosamine synthase-like glycosyltransferase